jgi:hypothetical protein
VTIVLSAAAIESRVSYQYPAAHIVVG